MISTFLENHPRKLEIANAVLGPDINLLWIRALEVGSQHYGKQEAKDDENESRRFYAFVLDGDPMQINRNPI